MIPSHKKTVSFYSTNSDFVFLFYATIFDLYSYYAYVVIQTVGLHDTSVFVRYDMLANNFSFRFCKATEAAAANQLVDEWKM